MGPPHVRRPCPAPLPAGAAPCYERNRVDCLEDIPIVSPDAATAAAPRPEFLGLGSFYKGTLAPWLEDHEGRRRRARRLRWLIFATAYPALAAWLYYEIVTDGDGFWFGVIFFLALATIVLANAALWRLQADVKSFVMESLAGYFKFTYQANPSFDGVDRFRDLDLLPYHSRASFEDGLKGEIKGVPFQMVEAKLTERRGTGKDAKTVTVFRGLLLSLPCEVTGPLAVWRRKKADRSFNDEWREVAVGDPLFDGTYVVHAPSPDVARRQLDAEARRVYAALDQRDDVDNVRLGMSERTLMVVVERGSDSFEAGKMNRPLADPDRIQAMVDLFAIPFDTVDGFKLQPPTPTPSDDADEEERP